MNLVKFSSLALGARFRYLSDLSGRIWIKLSGVGLGLIAEYDPIKISTSGWVGQSICSFADSVGGLDVDVICVEGMFAKALSK